MAGAPLLIPIILLIYFLCKFFGFTRAAAWIENKLLNIGGPPGAVQDNGQQELEENQEQERQFLPVQVNRRLETFASLKQECEWFLAGSGFPAAHHDIKNGHYS
ncbi:MAG: hypothetical protein ACRCXC_10940 [Legionella sp.]